MLIILHSEVKLSWWTLHTNTCPYHFVVITLLNHTRPRIRFICSDGLQSVDPSQQGICGWIGYKVAKNDQFPWHWITIHFAIGHLILFLSPLLSVYRESLDNWPPFHTIVCRLPQMMMSIHIFSMNVDIYHRVFLLDSVSFIVRPSFSSACKWMVWCGRDMKDTRKRKEGDWYWCPNDVHSQMSRGTRRTNSTSSPLSLCQVDPLRTTTTWIAV